MRSQPHGRLTGILKPITDRIFARWSHAPRRRSWIVLSIMAAVTVAGAYSLRYLNTSYTIRQFMPADHPLYKNDNDIQKTFSISEEQPMLITLELKPEEKGTWLEPSRMDVLKNATAAVAKLDGIKKATSIANIQTAADTPKGLQVGTWAELVPPAKWKEKVEHDRLLSPMLLSKDSRIALIVADIGFLTTIKGNLIISEIREQLGQIASIADTRVGGVIPIQYDMAQLLTQELGRFLILAFFLCFFTLLAYFRSFTSIVNCLLLVIVSNVGALSWMALRGYPFSVLSTSVPVLASIMALMIGSHTLINLGNEWDSDVKSLKHGAKHLRSGELEKLHAPSKIHRVIATYRSLFLPSLLMALTTAVGFATLIPSKVPLIQQYAWSVSGGIMVSWALVSILLLPLMYLSPMPEVRAWTSSKARWALWIGKNFWLVFLAIAGLALGLGLHGDHLNWSVRLFDDLPNQRNLKSTSDLIDHSFGGMVPLDIMITAPNETDAWNDPVRMQKLQRILTKWRQDPIVGSAIGLPDFVHAGEGFLVAKTRQGIAELLFLYSFSESNPVSGFLTSDGKSTRLSFRLRDVQSDQMGALVKSVDAELHSEFPDLKIVTGGMATMVHVLNEELSRQMITGLWDSLAVISILMIFVFRSLLWTVLAAVPNLLAPLILLSTLSVFKTPIKPGVAIIFSIALGVAYNNTVYLLVRLRDLLKSSDNPCKRTIVKAWYQEGNPCFFATLAMAAGFTIFLTSYFILNRTFGAYMIVSICAGLLGDLIFLPAFLNVLPWSWFERKAGGGK